MPLVYEGHVPVVMRKTHGDHSRFFLKHTTTPSRDKQKNHKKTKQNKKTSLKRQNQKTNTHVSSLWFSCSIICSRSGRMPLGCPMSSSSVLRDERAGGVPVAAPSAAAASAVNTKDLRRVVHGSNCFSLDPKILRKKKSGHKKKLI